MSPRISAAEARRLAERSAPWTPQGSCYRSGLELQVELPFSVHLLKNHAHTLRRHLTAEAKAARQAVIEAVQVARLRGERRRWPTRKTWLNVQVWKPSHKADAINVLDGLADSVKEALGIDDRWFSVRGLDWGIDAQAPRIILTIEADSWEDQLVCGGCGAIYEERDAILKTRCGQCSRRARGLA